MEENTNTDRGLGQRQDVPSSSAPDPSVESKASRESPSHSKIDAPIRPILTEKSTPHGSDKPRKSVQLPRDEPRKSSHIMREADRRKSEEITRAARRSTQLSRQSLGGQASRDFDIRLDGPYGRPSITMVRRRSSLATLATMHHDVAKADERPDVDLDATTPDIEALRNFHIIDDTGVEPEPPRLNYTLRTRKWSIVFFWSLIIIDCVFMPIGLYFGLWYGTDLSPNIVFSVVTAALGGVSIFEYILRFWRLYKKSSTCRVIGARRLYLDWFHWNFSFGWGIIMVELIVGTVPDYPPIRLLAMPVTSMLFVFATELLVIDTLRYFEIPAPVRISSIPRGSQLRPGIYSMIEDVCAVDGSGGTAFREALNKRYEASHVFRAMLRRLGAFWAFGAMTMAVTCTVLIFTIQDQAAYVVGWSAPFVWAGVWTAITFWYVGKKLREEKKAWTDELEEKAGELAATDVSQPHSEEMERGKRDERDERDLAPDELPDSRPRSQLEKETHVSPHPHSVVLEASTTDANHTAAG